MAATVAVHRFARFFQFDHFISAKHLCEFAFGALADGFHRRVGGGITTLGCHRFHHGATLALRVGHDGGDLGSARSVNT